MTSLLIALLMWISPPDFLVSLPNFPNYNTEYHYTIVMPPGAREAVVMWYAGREMKNNLIYNSGVVPLTTGVLRTEMFFPVPGRYLLVVYAGRGNKIWKHRQIYTVVAML